MNLIHYLLATDEELPAIPPGLYEYVFAANGIFVRAERIGLDAMVKIGSTIIPIRGLRDLAPHIYIEPVPRRITARMVELAYLAEHREIMFYLLPDPWRLLTPDQVGRGSCVTYNAELGGQALIEVHSHHEMGAFFSAIDNHDETGFRIYGVLGNLYHEPMLRIRIGIYGHMWEIPARWVFELPAGLRDSIDEEVDHLYDYVYSHVEPTDEL